MLYLMTATNLLTAIAISSISPVLAGLLVVVAVGCLATAIYCQLMS